jgi:hypothetical protein
MAYQNLILQSEFLGLLRSELISVSNIFYSFKQESFAHCVLKLFLHLYVFIGLVFEI